MIIFYADAGWQLNVTNLKITFVEENALFYDAFFKNYSLPFSLPPDDETSLKLGLIDVANVSSYKVKHSGNLFMDNKFFESYLLVENEQGNLEGVFTFGKMTLPLLDTPLSELPFPLITTTDLNTWAKSIKDKVYPDVSHAFPMVFDDEFKKETNYDYFEGIVNNFDGTDFITNSIDGGTGDVLNKNIMTPFPFLMHILKVGFATENMEMIGAFVNHKPNNHILIDPKKHLEQFATTTYDNYQFKQTTDEYLDGSILVSEYEKIHELNTIGSFSVKASLNLPPGVKVRKFSIIKANKELFSTVGNTVSETVTVNKEAATPTEYITVRLILENATGLNVELYNNITFSKQEGKLNEFKNTFSLAEFMQDMTFGKLLAKVKNHQNLKVVLFDSHVRMDYVEDVFQEVSFKNEKPFEITQPKRKFNENKIYKLQYSATNYILVDKNGLASTTNSFRDEDIVKIDMAVSMMQVEKRGTLFSALRNKADKFAMLLYNGEDASGYPVAVDNIDGYNFSLQEVYDLRWKYWLQFRLNSEIYTDKFEAHSLEEFLINEGRLKYNKNHIYKKIKKTRISETMFSFEIESETF